ARLALEAGADLPLLGHLPGQEAIVDAVAALSFPESRQRIERVRASLTYDLPPLDSSGWDSHRDVAAATARAAITVAHGAEALPLRLAPSDRLCLVSVISGNLTPAETVGEANTALIDQVRRRHAGTTHLELEYGASDGAIEAVVADCREADAVVLATVNAATDPSQRRLFERLDAVGKTPTVL